MNQEIKDARYKFFQMAESRIFAAGSCMLILWVSLIAAMWQLDHPYTQKLLGMGFVHLPLGRGASILQATKAGLPKPLITVLAIYLDVMVMFIVYPVLVFSYKNLFERKFFKQHVRSIFDSAQANMLRLRRLKIVGIFFFVWFPFHMTGIIAGAVIGYLLGLRTWVTMTTVILGSACAIVMWVFVIGELFAGLRVVVSERTAGAVVFLIVVVLALLQIRRRQAANGSSAGAEVE